MHLLHMVAQAADLFSSIPQVEEYRGLREELQSDCPVGWSLARELELRYWRHFWGFPYALAVLRQNVGNASLPGDMARDMRSLLEHKTTSHLESLSETLGKFADSLHSYFLKSETYLEAAPLHLQPTLRRSLLDIKGCFRGLQELRNIRSVLDKAVVDNLQAELYEKAEIYEQELKGRKIPPISPHAYDLALEIAGPDRSSRRILLAIKQASDMDKTIKELLFQQSAYEPKCSFYIDGELVNLQCEEKPFGRLVHSHMANILPLMIPGQILRFDEPSEALPKYMVALSVLTQFDGETKVLTIDITGIDLEEAGPRLLSRFVEN